MVLVLNSTREEFDKKVMELNEARKKVNFALGTCFREDDIDIRKALSDADAEMYADKNEYYQDHPELKYR